VEFLFKICIIMAKSEAKSAFPPAQLLCYEQLAKTTATITANCAALQRVDSSAAAGKRRAEVLKSVDTLGLDTKKVSVQAVKNIKSLREWLDSATDGDVVKDRKDGKRGERKDGESKQTKRSHHLVAQNLLTNAEAEYRRVSSEFATAFERTGAQFYEQDARRLRNLGDSRGQALSDEQIASVIERGQADALVQGALMADDNARLSDLVADIEERHVQILHLEQSILELRALMTDLALMIDEQGETIDRTVDHVEKSRDAIETGEKDCKAAEKYQRKGRKLRNGLLVAAALGLAAVVTVPTAVLKLA